MVEPRYTPKRRKVYLDEHNKPLMDESQPTGSGDLLQRGRRGGWNR
jgi:hypothetical protein